MLDVYTWRDWRFLYCSRFSTLCGVYYKKIKFRTPQVFSGILTFDPYLILNKYTTKFIYFLIYSFDTHIYIRNVDGSGQETDACSTKEVHLTPEEGLGKGHSTHDERKGSGSMLGGRAHLRHPALSEPGGPHAHHVQGYSGLGEVRNTYPPVCVQS